jgi:hypothetical protein
MVPGVLELVQTHLDRPARHLRGSRETTVAWFRRIELQAEETPRSAEGCGGSGGHLGALAPGPVVAAARGHPRGVNPST